LTNKYIIIFTILFTQRRKLCEIKNDNENENENLEEEISLNGEEGENIEEIMLRR
jgi:hypothetical protein